MSNTLQSNKQAMRDFVTALGNGNVAAVAAVVTDDVKIVTMGTSIVSATRDRAQLLELVRELSAITQSGIELKFISFTAEEDRVSCEMEGRSRLVNGGSYNNQYHLLGHFRDGKLYLLKEYIDTKYTDAALGSVLAQLAPNQ